MSSGSSSAHEDHVSLEEVSQARIMLVDDLEANLLALDGLLRGDDVRLLHAHSGREALELLLAEEVALTIIDVQMPVMNGFELAELMRGTERTRQIPIMFITAGGQNEQHRFRGYDAGAVDFLYKPIEPDILRQKVAVFLALYRSRRKIINQRDELLRRETALCESEERLQMALAASRTVGFDWDMLAGTVVYTANAPDVLGLAAQVDEAAACRCVDPEDAAPARAAVEGAIAEGREYRFDLNFRRPDNGENLWLDCRGKGERDASGRAVRAFGVATDITERKRAEEELRRSAEEIQAVVDATPALVWFAHDAQCSRVTGNEAANRLLGVSPGTNLSQTPGDGPAIAIQHFTPDGREMAPTDLPMQRAIATGRAIANTEVEFRLGDGRRLHVFGNATPLFDLAGEVRGCVAAFLDITQRTKAEEKFHLAVEAAPNGMMVANARGEIILVNECTEKLFGYTRAELIGQPIELLVPERFRGSHQRDRKSFLAEPRARPMGAGRDLYGRRKDGSEFPVEIGLNPIQTNGEVLVLGSIVDITERRESEAARRLLASVVESSVDAIISKDLDGVITSWNSGAERMFGYSAEEMVGRTISVLIPANQVNEIPAALERIKRAEPVEQYETVRQTKNGNLITVSITWSPIHDARGRLLGVSKLVRDITGRKQMEEQRLELLAKERALESERALREIEAELARVVRALSVGELATSIAHEINQPLAGVVTNAEAAVRWLSGDKPNIPEARESLALIGRDGNRASAVIRRIREFLRKAPQETALLDINYVVREAAALARPELLRRKVTLRLELSSESAQVRGDRIQLQQVVLNLIMNGAEAMNSLEGMTELHVASRKSADGGVLIAVKDSGAGISPEDMARMFDPFFTTKPTGMGMGLSISRTIIEAHGGRIWAESNTDRGLTVQFGLPSEGFSQAASNPS